MSLLNLFKKFVFEEPITEKEFKKMVFESNIITAKNEIESYMRASDSNPLKNFYKFKIERILGSKKKLKMTKKLQIALDSKY